MENSSALAKRFREVVLNGTWIAQTNYKQQLSGMHWETATAKPGTVNTIALLAQHIHYYISGVLTVFKGGPLSIRDRFSFDFPPVQSQEDWDAFLSQFWRDAEEFASLVEQLPEETLNDDFVDPNYGTYLRNIDGMIEHCYYHLGQIVLIRKLLAANNEQTA